jgi:AraC-like DNA-binding protein
MTTIEPMVIKRGCSDEATVTGARGVSQRSSRANISAAPTRRLVRARDAIDGRYSEPLDVAALASVAGLSRAHFSREFRRAFGKAPHQYLLALRLERAAELLRMTERPVKEICSSVGWRSVGSFTATFSKKFGVPPTAYRSHTASAHRQRTASKA